MTHAEKAERRQKIRAFRDAKLRHLHGIPNAEAEIVGPAHVAELTAALSVHNATWAAARRKLGAEYPADPTGLTLAQWAVAARSLGVTEEAVRKLMA